jgi:hypothetical protein
MSWFDNRKQDVEAAIVGGLIGWEAHKQDMEELDWATVEAIADEHDIDLTGVRSFILDKAVDIGFRIRDELS